MINVRASGATWILGAAIVGLVVVGYVQPPTSVFVVALVPLAVAAWLMSTPRDISLYLLLLGVQIPQSAVLLRLALADFFLLPPIARTVLASARTRRWPHETTLRGPMIGLLAALALGTLVALARTGQVSSYALFNKDLGLLFLIAGAFTLLCYMRTLDDVRRCVNLFVVGVSVANLVALGAAVLIFFGLSDMLYLSSQRLNGLMLNPSSYGALVTTAAMLELPRLASRDAVPPAIRWVNFALLLAATGLTLSRSAWVSLAAGAGGLLLVWLCSRRRADRVPLRLWATAVITMAVPTLVLLWIATAHSNTLAMLRGDTAVQRAADLQAQLVGQCVTRWDPGLCNLIPIELIEAERARQRRETESPRIAPRESPVEASRSDGALMNARGLEDRVAILRTGWSDYRATLGTTLLGIGLGSFYATSGQTFGVPLIIHNTAAWFLIEMGPLGLAVLAWLLARTGLNLWRTRQLPTWQGAVCHGVTAALSGWLAFSLFNEAFYLRHFWLLLVLADRLYVLSGVSANPIEASAPERAAV